MVRDTLIYPLQNLRFVIKQKTSLSVSLKKMETGVSDEFRPANFSSSNGQNDNNSKSMSSLPVALSNKTVRGTLILGTCYSNKIIATLVSPKPTASA